MEVGGEGGYITASSERGEQASVQVACRKNKVWGLIRASAIRCLMRLWSWLPTMGQLVGLSCIFDLIRPPVKGNAVKSHETTRYLRRSPSKVFADAKKTPVDLLP